MTQHPITPPPQLAAKWVNEIYGDDGFGFDVPLHPITLRLVERAAQWGADQELEACLGEVSFLNSQTLADRVREKRRRQPPSLKEKALKGLANMVERGHLASDLAADLRALLEQLDD